MLTYTYAVATARALLAFIHCHQVALISSDGHNNRTVGRTDSCCSHLTACLAHRNMRLSSAGSHILRHSPFLLQRNAAVRGLLARASVLYTPPRLEETQLHSTSCWSWFLQFPIAAMKQDPTVDSDPTNACAINTSSRSSLRIVTLPCLLACPLRGMHSFITSDARNGNVAAGAESGQ